MSRNRTKYPIPFLWKPRDAGNFGNSKAQLSHNRCGVTNFYFIKAWRSAVLTVLFFQGLLNTETRTRFDFHIGFGDIFADHTD